MTMPTAARALFVLGLVAVAFVTLAPIEFRPETGLSPEKERFAAFLLLGGLAAMAFPGHRVRALTILIVLAGLLEALQTLVPGRHGRVWDFDAKALGAIFGVAFAALGFAALRRRTRLPGAARGP